MNYNTIIKSAQKLHDNAKNGSLKFNGQKYTFIFTQGIYEVTDESGEQVTRLNTRKITIARIWLKEYLEN
jgi:hypothetical protein